MNEMKNEQSKENANLHITEHYVNTIRTTTNIVIEISPLLNETKRNTGDGRKNIKFVWSTKKL